MKSTYEILKQVINILPKEIQAFFTKKTVDLSIDLLNLNDLSYQAKVYVGSDKQGLDVIYDTGSDYLVLQASDCSTCESDKFDSATSTTYAVVDGSTKT